MRKYYNVNNFGTIELFLGNSTHDLELELGRKLQCTKVDINNGVITRNNRRISESKIGVVEKEKNTNRYYFTLIVSKNQTEKIYLDDFYYYSYNDLIRLVSQNKYICSDLILATLINESDKIGLIAELPKIETGMSFGVCMCGNETMKVLCYPDKDNERYPIDSWAYKMSLVPIQKDLNYFCAPMTTYTSTIIDMIKDGKIKMVAREEYEEKIKEEAKEKANKYNKYMGNYFNKIKHVLLKNNKLPYNFNIVDIPVISHQGIAHITGIITTLTEDELYFLYPVNN